MTEETQDIPAEAVVEAEPATAVAETNVAPEPAKPAAIPKERFDEVYRNWRESQREVEYLRETSRKETVKPETPPVQPSPEQYGFDDAKYQTAVTEFNRSVARAEAISAYKAEREQEQQRTKETEFRKREADFAAKTPDYQDKLYNAKVPISQATAELIKESDDGPAIAYYLANNLELAYRISDLSPVQAAREIGRIEARLSQTAVVPKPNLTKAPPPPPTIDADEPVISVNPSEPESDKLSMSEWVKRRNKQIYKKR